MSRRTLGGLSILLALAATALGVYTFQLRGRLARAELYVQSGADSVFIICSPIARALSESAQPGNLLEVARTCVGQFSEAEMVTASDEFQRKDLNAIARRLAARLDARELPYKISSQVEAGRLPMSYRE